MPTNHNFNDIPLEELREKYLGKKRKKRSSVYSYSNQLENSSTEEFLFSQRTRSTPRFVLDIILFLVIVSVSYLVLSSFAVESLEIGEKVQESEAMNIVEFIYVAPNSIVNQMKENVENLKDISIDDSESLVAFGSIMMLIRLTFLLFPALIVLLNIIIEFIKALVFLLSKKSAELAKCAIKIVSQNLTVFIFFSFFGSISGGSNESSYYIGYKASDGVVMATIIGVVALLCISIATFFINKNKSDCLSTISNYRWASALCSVVIYSILGAIVSSMRIYSISSYAMSSALSTAISGFLSEFELEALIFPLLNVFLFISCLIVASKIKKGFINELGVLLYYKEHLGQNLKRKITTMKQNSKNFIVLIIFSFTSLISIIILKIPSLGFGWSVDVYRHFAFILLFSSIAQTLLSFFKKVPISK